ncbi:ATP-binding protein [Thioclava sp. F36-7]|uniref:ATP-binding protein n=1 Tax=Thioclava sp. F36-7 TaxID=1915317 RepID=UPI0009D58C98|nr:ATP-binding protein [Thioclava sp. F36-7]OOY07758.1 hypothetical protein BMI89_15130 [Thioclava sp. F36-7]
MNEFVIPEIVALSGGLAARHYPLGRARILQNSFSQLLSRHIGGLQSGARFETGALLVTGPSGAGKSKEIGDLLGRFNASDTRLPSGEKASFACCVLSSKGGWKDLGKHTLRALGYPIHDKARRTQTEIWNLVVDQAKRKGCIGIHYDEAQHGIAETQRVIDFAAHHGVAATYEMITPEQIGEACEKVVNKQARYRYVIDMTQA